MILKHIAAAASRRRTLVGGCVLLLLAVGLVQTWFIDGLVIPCRVEGGSMAGTLLGAHRAVVCYDCGFGFVCGADVPPPAACAVCPNCGYADNRIESLPEAGADRVLIDRAAFSMRAPRRWETVAFRRAAQADRILVKRIVGLPGESIELRHGDVYADGSICRKDLAQQRALAILVYDADYRPTRSPAPPRWRAESSESRWTAAGGCFTHAAGTDSGPIDWLVYRHWRRRPVGRASSPDRSLPGNTEELFLETPVTDSCGYNASQPRREEDVHAATDLMLSLRLVRVSGQGTLCIRASDGRDSFETRLSFDGDRPRYRVFHNGQPIDAAAGKVSMNCSGDADAGATIEVSLIDRQFLLAVNGQTIVVWPYDRPDPPRTATPCPLAIGARGLGATVCGVRVYRDVYYTHPIGPPGRRPGDQPLQLAAEHYYVLGDNSPISDDSRTWPEPGAADAKLFVGKPLAAIPAVSIPLGGRWHFQVPNPLEIRYIR